MASKWYSVAKGRQTGIFTDWKTCSASVTGFSGAVFKSFLSRSEAENFLQLQMVVNTTQAKESVTVKDANMIQTPSKITKIPDKEKDAKTSDVFGKLEVSKREQAQSVHMYTDGSFSDGKGGYGIVIADLNGVTREFSGRIRGECTNQVAELYAVYIGLSLLKSKLPVVIYTDSQYVIGCLSKWIKVWMKNNWRTSEGKPVANRELIEKCYSFVKENNITFVHVYGHRGNKYNELADRLANLGRLSPIGESFLKVEKSESF